MTTRSSPGVDGMGLIYENETGARTSLGLTETASVVAPPATTVAGAIAVVDKRLDRVRVIDV